jgi:hypothetical protein
MAEFEKIFPLTLIPSLIFTTGERKANQADMGGTSDLSPPCH